jgi:predicted nucleic acid-binding protein
LNKSLAIIDSSIAIYNIIETDQSATAAALLQHLNNQDIRLFVPRLWMFEVVSGIRKYHYAKMISDDQADKAILLAHQFGMSYVDETPDLCTAALHWANRLGQMAAYDGFYLAAAEMMDAPLWTGDKRLFNGTRQTGADWVHWMGED